MSETLTFVGFGPNGILFRDGERLYMVWPSRTPGINWSGMEVRRHDAAFTTCYPDWCGAEVDMRQDESDPVTPEIMALADRMAKTLNAFFKNEEKRVAADLKAQGVNL